MVDIVGIKGPRGGFDSDEAGFKLGNCHKVVSVPPKVKLPTSFAAHSHGVTGGVYKARDMTITLYLKTNLIMI